MVKMGPKHREPTRRELRQMLRNTPSPCMAMAASDSVPEDNQPTPYISISTSVSTNSIGSIDLKPVSRRLLPRSRKAGGRHKPIVIPHSTVISPRRKSTQSPVHKRKASSDIEDGGFATADLLRALQARFQHTGADMTEKAATLRRLKTTTHSKSLSKRASKDACPVTPCYLQTSLPTPTDTPTTPRAVALSPLPATTAPISSGDDPFVSGSTTKPSMCLSPYNMPSDPSELRQPHLQRQNDAGSRIPRPASYNTLSLGETSSPIVSLPDTPVPLNFRTPRPFSTTQKQTVFVVESTSISPVVANGACVDVAPPFPCAGSVLSQNVTSRPMLFTPETPVLSPLHGPAASDLDKSQFQHLRRVPDAISSSTWKVPTLLSPPETPLSSANSPPRSSIVRDRSSGPAACPQPSTTMLQTSGLHTVYRSDDQKSVVAGTILLEPGRDFPVGGSVVADSAVSSDELTNSSTVETVKRNAPQTPATGTRPPPRTAGRDKKAHRPLQPICVPRQRPTSLDGTHIATTSRYQKENVEPTLQARVNLRETKGTADKVFPSAPGQPSRIMPRRSDSIAIARSTASAVTPKTTSIVILNPNHPQPQRQQSRVSVPAKGPAMASPEPTSSSPPTQLVRHGLLANGLACDRGQLPPSNAVSSKAAAIAPLIPPPRRTNSSLTARPVIRSSSVHETRSTRARNPSLKASIRRSSLVDAVKIPSPPSILDCAPQPLSNSEFKAHGSDLECAGCDEPQRMPPGAYTPDDPEPEDHGTHNPARSGGVRNFVRMVGDALASPWRAKAAWR